MSYHARLPAAIDFQTGEISFVADRWGGTSTEEGMDERKPLTLESLEEIAASFRDLVTKIEAGDEETANWLFHLLRATAPPEMALDLLGLPAIEICPWLAPNSFLTRNSRGEALDLFIRKEEGSFLKIDLRRDMIEKRCLGHIR